MRVIAFVLALLLSAPAMAAPICFNRAGDAVHCDVKGAMPVGWKLPPEEAMRREMEQPRVPASSILKVAAGIALLFALIALLPEFDGARDQDWDEQEKRGPD